MQPPSIFRVQTRMFLISSLLCSWAVSGIADHGYTDLQYESIPYAEPSLNTVIIKPRVPNNTLPDDDATDSRFQEDAYQTATQGYDPPPAQEPRPYYFLKPKSSYGKSPWRLWKRQPYSASLRKKYTKGYRSDPTYSRSDYVPEVKRRRHNKWLDRQGGFFEDMLEDFSMSSFLPDIPGLLFGGLDDDGDGDDVEDDEDGMFEHLFGLNEHEDDEPIPEESFLRPAIFGHPDEQYLFFPGYDNKAAPVRGSSWKGMKSLLLRQPPHTADRRIFGRYAMKRVFGKGIKLLIALMLLPLLLLFIPVPIVSSNSSRRNQNPDAENPEQWSSIQEFGKRVLGSEECIERIACEISRSQQATAGGAGGESSDYSFGKFVRFVNKFSTFFPTVLVRVARGYVDNSLDGGDRCYRFTCHSLPNGN